MSLNSSVLRNVANNEKLFWLLNKKRAFPNQSEIPFCKKFYWLFSDYRPKFFLKSTHKTFHCFINYFIG